MMRHLNKILQILRASRKHACAVHAQNKQEFRRIVLCHQLWLKTEVDEIQKDKNYAEHK